MREFAPEVNTSEKVYSPSAGNVCSTTIPPRVPNGAPSTWSHGCCDTYCEFLYVVLTAGALRSPTAMRLISAAAFR